MKKFMQNRVYLLDYSSIQAIKIICNLPLRHATIHRTVPTMPWISLVGFKQPAYGFYDSNIYDSNIYNSNIHNSNVYNSNVYNSNVYNKPGS